MAKRDEYETGAPETIVGASVKIEGDLIGEGDIQIDGTVSGKIKTNKNLNIGPAARVEADVEATNASIAGMIKGDIKIKEALVILETGKVEGNITCARLAIAEGGHFSGTSTMTEQAGTDEFRQESVEEE